MIGKQLCYNSDNHNCAFAREKDNCGYLDVFGGNGEKCSSIDN
jgi:hypothetical protein